MDGDYGSGKLHEQGLYGEGFRAVLVLGELAEEGCAQAACPPWGAGDGLCAVPSPLGTRDKMLAFCLLRLLPPPIAETWRLFLPLSYTFA